MLKKYTCEGQPDVYLEVDDLEPETQAVLVASFLYPGSFCEGNCQRATLSDRWRAYYVVCLALSVLGRTDEDLIRWFRQEEADDPGCLAELPEEMQEQLLPYLRNLPNA